MKMNCGVFTKPATTGQGIPTKSPEGLKIVRITWFLGGFHRDLIGPMYLRKMEVLGNGPVSDFLDLVLRRYDVVEFEASLIRREDEHPAWG